MTESAFWRDTVRPAFALYGQVQRIENVAGLGTPDVLFCLALGGQAATGLIELKQADSWPVRADTIMKFPHFTLEQLRWLEDWAEAGCRCALLCRVGVDTFAYDGSRARLVYTGLIREHMLKKACVRGAGHFPAKDLIRWLTRP
jgi:hypothetical protein